MYPDQIATNEFELIIEWDVRPADKFEPGWLSKEQYEKYLIEETTDLGH